MFELSQARMLELAAYLSLSLGETLASGQTCSMGLLAVLFMHLSSHALLIHAGQDWVLAMSIQALASVLMPPFLGVHSTTALLNQAIAAASVSYPPSRMLFI